VTVVCGCLQPSYSMMSTPEGLAQAPSLIEGHWAARKNLSGCELRGVWLRKSETGEENVIRRGTRGRVRIRCTLVRQGAESSVALLVRVLDLMGLKQRRELYICWYVNRLRLVRLAVI
jgi:hypothetical protein